MEDFRDIIERVWRGDSVPPRDVGALLDWLHTPRGRADFEQGVQREWAAFGSAPGADAAPDMEKILRAIHSRMHAQGRKKPHRGRWIAAAAAAAVVVAVVAVRLFDTPVQLGTPSPPTQQGIALTLSDGSVVPVESLEGGRLGDANVARGAIEYAAGQDGAPVNSNVRHTLSIPRGRDYRLTLSDGSTVWLGGGTQLRYPVRFDGKEERRVEMLGGEACFEVQADPEHPFIVESHGQDIAALGTRFNVAESGGGREIITTLARGLVRITAGGGQTVLTPGRQAVFDTQTGLTRQRLVDAEEVMAWRDGYIVIENQTLEQVLEKMGAWYDVDWTIAPDVPHGMVFRGKIKRQEIEPTLKRFEMVSGLHVRLAGGVIRVTKE